MNYEVVEETIKAGYRAVSSQYRRDDEIEVTTANHERICRTLQRICASFPHAIKALDVGCGTGRYFHCLTNVEELIGLDISEEMLQAAETPVRQELISAKKIVRTRGNIYLSTFEPESFHFIYSLGMFGNGCPVTVEICNKVHEWLAPGGKLYFNTVDFAGLPLWYRARRQARHFVYPMLSRRLQTILDEREARQPSFSMYRGELEAIMRRTKFSAVQIMSHVCESPLWNGRHLECIASKAAE
jgi:SAM-dependent methyltransferase